MKQKFSILSGLAAVLLATAGLSTHAHAVPVGSLAGGSVLALPTAEKTGADGIQQITPDVTWESNESASLFGHAGPHGFYFESAWNDGISMIAANSHTAIMTIKFANPVQGVGAFLNWSMDYNLFPEDPLSALSPTIAIFDVNGSEIESLDLAALTPPTGENTGQFFGFLTAAPTIGSFTLTGAFMVARDLAVVNEQVGQVPEPAVLTLLGIGLAGIGMTRRRRI